MSDADDDGIVDMVDQMWNLEVETRTCSRFREEGGSSGKLLQETATGQRRQPSDMGLARIASAQRSNLVIRES